MSKLREINDEKREMQMTPMIDVVFLLLIFFMCTLKFKTLEGKLAAYLPKDVGVNPGGEPIDRVDLHIAVGRTSECAYRLDQSREGLIGGNCAVVFRP